VLAIQRFKGSSPATIASIGMKENYKKKLFFTASIISTEVANSANNAKVEGLSPATVAGISRKKMKKKMLFIFLSRFFFEAC
jgi:hypothetical protein